MLLLLCYSHFAYPSLYNLLLHVISTTMLPEIMPGGTPREAGTTLFAVTELRYSVQEPGLTSGIQVALLHPIKNVTLNTWRRYLFSGHVSSSPYLGF